MNGNFSLVKQVSNQFELQSKVSGDVWPEFMYHDTVANEHWMKLYEWFSPFQITLLNGEDVVAIANSMPYFWDKSYDELPDEGWDWALQKGVGDYQNGVKPNALNGLQISVNKKYLGQGISSIMLNEMKNLAIEHDLKHISLPVRPSLKEKYPLTPFAKYINWKNDNGFPIDPWLRVHMKFGGKIIKPCYKSMYIPGTIQAWQEWTGLLFFESGEYVIQGALNPVKMNLEKNLGEYFEPNVWVVHEISKS
jgi:hypothetical protein